MPVSTIKYYLREKLLPAGHLTSANQADYTEEHLHRLRVIRVLVEVGGLSTATVQEVVTALRTAEDGMPSSGLGALRARVVASTCDEDDDVARTVVQAFLERRGWRCDAAHPAVRALVTALSAARSLGDAQLAGRLDLYADVSLRTAQAELADLAAGRSDREAVVATVVGGVLGDVVLSALRGLAVEHLLGTAAASHPAQ